MKSNINFNLLERAKIYLNELKESSPYNPSVYFAIFIVALMMIVKEKL